MGRLVAGGGELGEDRRGLRRVDTEHEAAGGLRIGEQQLVHLVVVSDLDELQCPRQVPRAAAGHHAVGRQFDGARQKWHCGELEVDRDLGLECHSAEMAEQTEAGHVGAAGDPGSQCQTGGNVVEADHRCDRSVGLLLGGLTSLDGGGQHADAECLGEDDVLTGAQARIGEEPVRMGFAGDRHAVLGFGVVDRVAAGDHEAGLGGDVLAACEHLAEQCGRQRVGVPADEIQCKQRPTAHRVDVRDAVGSGHTAPGARVVDHRRDEVGGRHEGALVVETPDRGVVAGLGADQ